MGAWSAHLYGNDTALDVRDIYMGFLKEQLGNEEAFQKTLEKCHEYIEGEEEALFWYALADTQWRVGRLMPKVKEKALWWIENNGGIELWEESKSGGRGWKKTLEKLKVKLNTPQPQEKKIRKPTPIVTNPWNVGDIYAYQFHTDEAKEYGLYGKYILFQKIGEEEVYDGEICSRIQIYDQLYNELPDSPILDGVRLLPIDNPNRFPPIGKAGMDWFPLNLNAVMEIFKKNGYPHSYLTFIDNIPDNRKMPCNKGAMATYGWDSLERWLSPFYHAWQNYDWYIKDGEILIKPREEKNEK